MKKQKFLRPTNTLRALRGPIGIGAFIPQAVEVQPGQCLWISEYAQKQYSSKNRFYESRCCLLIKAGAFANESLAESDAYICTGSNSLGSGRSVFVDQFQVKGVGRTTLCAYGSGDVDTDGRVSAQTVFYEIIKASWLQKLMTNPVIPLVAVLLVGKGIHSRLLLVRDGSPARLGHLYFLSASSARFLTKDKKRAAWTFFFNDMFDHHPVNLNDRTIEERFQFILDRALEEIAQTRVFGINLCNWIDNWDCFSRLFDNEEVSFCFETVIKPRFSTTVQIPQEADLRSWLNNLEINFNTPRLFRTLQPLVNAVQALELIADQIGFSESRLDLMLRRKRLEAKYETKVLQALQRLLGVSSNSAVQKLRQLIGESLNLIPSRQSKVLHSGIFLEELANLVKGQESIRRSHFETKVASSFYSVWNPSQVDKRNFALFFEKAAPLIIPGQFSRRISELGREVDALKRSQIKKDLPVKLEEALSMLSRLSFDR